MVKRFSRQLLVLGATLSGKSSVCRRFCDERFEETYMPTYSEAQFMTFRLHRGAEVDMTIKDTQGMDEGDVFRNEYCLGCHGYVLVFSITSQRSFDKVRHLHDRLLNLMGPLSVPCVLVGTKADLADERCVVNSVN